MFSSKTLLIPQLAHWRRSQFSSGLGYKWLCLFTLLVMAVPANSQSIKTALLVIVSSEESGELVVDARVKVMNRERTKVLAEKTTDSTGSAEFLEVFPRDVFVFAEKDQVGIDRIYLKLDDHKHNTFEASLSPGDQETEAIQVSGDLLRVKGQDPNSGAATSRNSDFMSRQLTNGDSLQGVLSTVAGLQTNSLGQVHARGEHKALSLALDGVDLPLATTSQITQPLDPAFLDSTTVSTGMYDASTGGQTGAVVSAKTKGEGEKPFVDVEAKLGDYGQSDLVFRAGGSDESRTFSYFVGARRSRSDLYLEAPNPHQQTLNNTGELSSFMVRFNKKTESNNFGLTLSHQTSEFGLPQTSQNFEAGVRQGQEDSNSLALFSWKHSITPNDDLLMGLAFQRNRLAVNNNGIFTPFESVPASLSQELSDEGLPLNPENAGSPYLPQTRLRISQIKPSLDYTHKFDDNHLLKAGASITVINSDQELFITDPGGGGGLPNPLGLPGLPTSFISNLERTATSGSLYLSHTYPVSEKVVLNYGLRADTFDNGLGFSTGQLSPRINLSYAPSDTQALRLSYNRVFQAPPIEIDVSGSGEVLPQRTHLYEASYENQFAKNWVGKVAYVYKDFRDQVDIGLLIPNSGLAVFAPVNFSRAFYRGLELSVSSHNEVGWNGFVAATLSEAKPTEGNTFTTDIPTFNDHDQRVQLSAGVSHTWDNGLSAGLDLLYGSGYPQDALTLYNSAGISPYGLTGDRHSRFITNLNLQYRPSAESGGTLGAGLQVFNLFNERPLLNFLSEFSGTRFATGRRFLLNLNAHF